MLPAVATLQNKIKKISILPMTNHSGEHCLLNLLFVDSINKSPPSTLPQPKWNQWFTQQNTTRVSQTKVALNSGVGILKMAQAMLRLLTLFECTHSAPPPPPPHPRRSPFSAPFISLCISEWFWREEDALTYVQKLRCQKGMGLGLLTDTL